MKSAIKELNNRKQDELYDRNGPHQYIQYLCHHYSSATREKLNEVNTTA